MIKKPTYFFVIYLKDNNFHKLLDAMRLVADPKQCNLAHITVKGPYKNAQRKRLHSDNNLIQGEEINILGAGNFFSDTQNTVYLRCEDNEELVNIWKGKDNNTYSEYHPHITIYDGGDAYFARELFDVIAKHNITFSFIVNKLDLYSSKDKQTLFNLKAEADYTLLSSLADKPINDQNIEALTGIERIHIIDKLCKKFDHIA